MKKIIIFVFFILMFCITYSLSGLYLDGDVLAEGIPFSIELFMMPIHSRYFGEVLERMIGLGNLYGIHPMDYINSIGALSIAATYAFLCYVITDSMYILRKKDYFFPVFFIFVYLILSGCNYVEDIIWTQFWGYPAQIIFLFLSLNMVIKYFTIKKVPCSAKEIILSSILTMLLGQACEFSNISFLFLLMILLGYFLLSIKFNPKLIINKIRKENIGLYIPLFLFLLVFVAAYTNPYFWECAKIDKNIEITNEFLTNSLFGLKDLIFDYFNILICQNKFILTIIIACIIFILISPKKREENIRYVLINLFILLGILLFFFMLLFLGKSDYNYGESYLFHCSLNTLYKLSLLYICFSILGRFLSVYTDIKYKFILCFLFCLFFAFNNPIFQHIKYIYGDRISEAKKVRRQWWIVDNIVNYSIYTSKDIYLPASAILNLSNSSTFFLDTDTDLSYTNENIMNSNGKYIDEALEGYAIYLNLTYNIPKKRAGILYIVPDKIAIKKLPEIKEIFNKSSSDEMNFSQIKEKYNISSLFYEQENEEEITEPETTESE